MGVALHRRQGDRSRVLQVDREGCELKEELQDTLQDQTRPNYVFGHVTLPSSFSSTPDYLVHIKSPIAVRSGAFLT